MQSISTPPCPGCYGRNLDIFDPFSLYFWDDFPFELPFRAPFMIPRLPMLPNMEPRIRSKIEYKETPEAHLFIAELPGLKREDVKVHVDDARVLHISAKSKHEMEEKRDNYYHHVERGFGAFSSSFKLPQNSRPEQFKWCVENGWLTVTVPKERVDHHMAENPRKQQQYY